MSITLPSKFRWSAVAALTAVAFVATACSSSGTGGGTSSAAADSASASGGSSSSSSAAPSSTKPTQPPATPVHVRLLNSDGSTYGIGMPVIAFFSKRIGSGKALQDKTTATANGRPLKVAWYFETSAANKGYPIEAHLRPQSYWPGHAKIHVNIPAKGLSAGTRKGVRMAFDDSLTLDFSTGAAHIGVVNDATHRLTITDDGKKWGSFPVSLGANNTPTAHGTKVIMEKGRSICMSGPGYNECGVKDTQRLTYGGEYLHSAPWNVGNINNGIDSSNGCTNLLPSDAAKLYSFLRVGDVVSYPNANGPAMSLGAGYGDWNVNWGTWQSGGLVSTTS